MNNRDHGGDEGCELKRRDFLKGVASAALTTGLTAPLMAPSLALAGEDDGANLPKKLLAPPTFEGNPSQEKFWSNVGMAFMLGKDYIHMNTGTTGSQPEFAVNNLAVYNRYKVTDPRDWEVNLNAKFPDRFPITPSAITARQTAVATAYNAASPSEIILSYDTTDGCNLIFAGTPWQAGDRIVTTSFEHPALLGPITWARDILGVEVVTIDMGLLSPFVSYTVQDVLDLFEPALAAPLAAGKRQYLAISEIFYKNGLRLPVPELCALARGYGAYSIIDSAHGFGMLPIDLAAYGADFLAGAGHKWLCGGSGTGILYVRNTGANLPPFNLGNFFFFPFVPLSVIQSRTYSPATYIQTRGEYNKPALYAMTDSLAMFQENGITTIYERGVELGNYLKAKIEAQWPGSLWVEARAPYDPFATALTSFNPFVGRDDSSAYATVSAALNAVVSALAAETPKIYIRSVTWKSNVAASADDRIGFRISTNAVYNGYAEVDHVFDRLVYQVAQTGLPTV